MESSYIAMQSRGDGCCNTATTTTRSNNVATNLVLNQAQSIVQNQGFMITSEEQLRREKRRQKKWTVLIAMIGLIGFFVALSVLLIVEVTTAITYIAFLFPIILGPYAIHQRRKLNKLPSLVFVMNQIRDQINVLMIENTKLYNENIRLENQIRKLQDSETKLEGYVQKSGHDVDTICALVKENANTQRQMKRLLNAQELQSLLTAILQSDTDSDHILSSHEIERLLLRLQSFSVVDTVKIREALLSLEGKSTSTTTIYNHLAMSSQDENDNEEGDFSLGYGDWLFEEA